METMELSEDDRVKIAELCRSYGIARLELFGSFARGQEREDSDLDLLYTMEAGRSMGWEIEDLTQELESIYGRPVDLVSRKYLHPLLREGVLEEARGVYAAQ